MKADAAAGEEPALIEKARRGDPYAFADLVRSFDHGFRLLAYRLLGDSQEMDDVLQDAYVKAFLALPRFRGDSTLRTWLYRVVYNTCLDHLKRERPQATALRPELETSVPDPAEIVATRTALEEALAALAWIDRAAVLLVDAEGLSYAAAAAVVGVAPGTIASRLSRARASLRRSLRTTREGVSG